MQRHKIVRKASVGVLLFLPLVAVGIALALMLTWGHQNAQQASADATSEIEFSIAVGACDTKNAGEANQCNIPEKTSFQLDMSWDGFSGGHAGDAPNVQLVVHWTGVVNGPTGKPGNDKSLVNTTFMGAPNPLAGCDIPVTVLQPGGDTTRIAVACGVLFSSNVATGVMGEAEFNCKNAGTGFIILEHSAAQSLATDAALQPHFEDNVADVLQINCLPLDGEININKVSKDNGSLLAGSCWEIFAVVATGLSAPNDTANLSLDVISDNNAVGQCDTTGLADLSDRNPDDGLIDINIGGKIQVATGTNVFTFKETKAPPKYAINDTTKYVCTFTNTPKTLDPGETGPKVGCDEDGGTSRTIQNARIEGNINITFNNPFGGAQTGICVDIDLGIGNVCDGDDGNSDGSISLTLANGVYSVALDASSVPTAVVAKAPTKVNADLNANKKVSIKFDFNTSTPVFEKKKALANLFLTAQGVKLGPEDCERSTDVAVFELNLTSGSTGVNEKGDPQDIRAFEYEVRFDGSQVCVSWTPGKFVTNNGMNCSKTFSEEKGLIEVGCVTQKTSPQVPIDNSNLQLGVIEVRPQPSLYSIIKATQDNGVVVQIRNDQCNLADLQGHAIESGKCPDSSLTIRWLEGDVNGDCIVDTADQQLLAFRWGVSKGVQLYNARFNLVGSNDVINIKDVQFVFGRHNSECDQFNRFNRTGPTNPPQDPVNKKATP